MSAVHELPPGISTEAAYYRVLPELGPRESLHAHEETTTIHVLKGIVYLIRDEDERAMTPGDEAVIPCGELHRIFNAGDGEAHVLDGVRPDDCTTTKG